jgi:hypothetical protein
VDSETVHKQLHGLELILQEAGKQDILTEVVWYAFRLQRTKGYDTLKAFDQSLWDWLLIQAKRKKKGCPKKLLEKLDKIKNGG